MKKAILISILFCVVLTCNVFASSPPWTGSGTYTFDDTDPYFVEDGIWDTATVNILGGSFGILYSYNNSVVNMTGGEGDLWARDSSQLYLWGGDIPGLVGSDNSDIKLYVDSYIFTPDIYVGYEGVFTGTWANNNGEFEIYLPREGTLSHIDVIVVPEPTLFILFGLGSLVVVSKRKLRK